MNSDKLLIVQNDGKVLRSWVWEISVMRLKRSLILNTAKDSHSAKQLYVEFWPEKIILPGFLETSPSTVLVEWFIDRGFKGTLIAAVNDPGLAKGLQEAGCSTVLSQEQLIPHLKQLLGP
ncbi:MAG TPA: hypothetical protein VEA59_03765 [Patescibacteria group bacterium]|nr:hypothetical protein [Patescibacteria group bacterium]